ncbi:glycine--tRNA ligase [bacterium]|nr:glycine--tRNA ligase [bacterium]
MPDNLMDKIVSLCKRRGFIFPDSEIYGGLANTWDFGPLGAEMKNNIKKEWWKAMVWHRDDVVGLDSAVIVNPKVWEASGHLSSFTDPLVECKQCHTRFRADYLKEGKYGPVVEKEGVFYCPLCGGELTKEKKFNLMFKTYIGPAEETANIAFLRPETAQGIFINFKKVLTSSRKKIPFGIAQIGKAFRNEITPSNFIFRTREFEQMEMEYFISPEEDKKWYDYWKEIRWKWYLSLGMKEENLRQRPHQEKELAHYAKEATDIEFKFPFGWSELEGIHNRTDYDLKRHQQFSNKDLSYWDEETHQKYIPYVIETSAGVERSLLAFLINAYTEEQDKNKETRVVLRLHPKIAPIKLAVLPLLKNNKELVQTARDIFLKLQRQVDYLIDYDEVGSIGRRYRRQDEVGTPWCVTIDHQTLEDQTVTIRDRDTMKQERIKTEEITHWVEEKLCINSL